MLGFPAPHARTGGVLIVAHRRLSTLTQYFTWFGKTAYIHGRESILFRDRERITTYMEEEDHFTQTQLPALNCCTCSCCNGSKAAALAALFLSTLLHTLTFSHSLNPLTLLSQNHASFIGIHGIFSTMAAHGLIHLSMVGATTIDKW